jgi:hypothetical protein
MFHSPQTDTHEGERPSDGTQTSIAIRAAAAQMVPRVSSEYRARRQTRSPNGGSSHCAAGGD